ncbi:MAG: ATP synthase F1 subunit delta [Chloroflexales bacterium]|nr:ATP synthase F1 subunit delta [Chloroflexales bacterium]
MSSPEARTFARALYETLLGNTIAQLRGASEKLASNADGAAPERIAAALPQNAPPELRNFLAVLAREGALEQLPAIVMALEEYAPRADRRPISGEITSAQPLSPEQRQRITADLTQRYGQQLELVFKEDTSLIGGLIIRVGDQVLDTSLRTRLSAVQRSMMTS